MFCSVDKSVMEGFSSREQHDSGMMLQAIQEHEEGSDNNTKNSNKNNNNASSSCYLGLRTMFSDESVHSFDSITATFEDSSFMALESFLEQQRSSEAAPLGSESTWNDEAKSDAETMGLNLYDSLVMALRDGANKMDAALTADHVGTLIEENKRLKRALVDKSRQVGELQSLVLIKDGRISTLELERDLYKADTTKLSNDVRALVVKVKAIEASSTSHETISTRTPSSSDPSSRKKRNGDDGDDQRHLLRSDSADASLPSDPGPRQGVVPAEPVPMIAIPNKSTSTGRPITTKLPKERSKHTGLGGRAMMFYRHMNNNTKLLAQQQSLPKKSTDRSDDDSDTDSVFTDQLQDLRQRLTNAMTTADELRRRLAMVSRYYEGALGKMEQDMFRKLSLLSTDKDKAMAQLQRRVRDLEDEQVRTQDLQLVAQTIDWKSNHS
jgi:hypothetical protein